MAGKNANGEGSIYKRMKDGKFVRFEGAISYADPDGRTRRYSVTGPTRAVVRDKLKEARERVQAGAPAKDSKMTVGHWLAHWRSTTLQASSRKPSTKELYGNLSRTHLEVDPFASIPLDRLRPSNIEALLLALRSKMKIVKRGEETETVRALSDSTIRTVYTVLRAGLDGAKRDQLIARNPAKVVARPGVQRAEAKHLPPADVATLLKAAEGTRYHLALALIASTGLRRGEALALKWSRIDLDKGVLKVRETVNRVNGELKMTETKTERSRRDIPLSPARVTELTAHREAQARERAAAGDKWIEHDLVFCTELGRPVDPRNLLRAVENAAKKAGISDVGVHTFRHSAGTAWLEGGVHIKAVSDLLGHSSISITGDIYGHTSDETARAAVELLEKQLSD